MTTKQLLDYQNIIKTKGWKKNPLHKSVEKKMFQLFTNLNKIEIDLILELLEKFTWIGNNQYDKKILDIFRKIEDKLIKKAERFYFFPVVKPYDSHKLKSGLSLIYPVVGILNYIEYLDHIDKGGKNIITKYKSLRKLKLKENEFLILVDDFVGSGKTLETCIKTIESYKIPLEKLILISIAIHNDGLNLVNKKEIKAYYSHIEKKGITDYFFDEEQMRRKSLMKLMERKLKFKPKFSLGFEESEALLSLIRTPNNTFPIFWHEYYYRETLHKAPFPR
ncbi:phosphoribosyltransferase [Ulvibacterium marinum]|uniref:Phosphoribosyltransferase n=1 Tax=Ulvibacterium marinum TaxID=2419782 RepID=A0A3B0CGL5_9FLAO|nr:phosphoribosyltransferase [Ulvibacterium marinum]RKN83237.1 phosphoribosyltransferase [Ulvibacterium marinum]